jgi:hypothetical protein
LRHRLLEPGFGESRRTRGARDELPDIEIADDPPEIKYDCLYVHVEEALFLTVPLLFGSIDDNAAGGINDGAAGAIRV